MRRMTSPTPCWLPRFDERRSRSACRAEPKGTHRTPRWPPCGRRVIPRRARAGRSGVRPQPRMWREGRTMERSHERQERNPASGNVRGLFQNGACLFPDLMKNGKGRMNAKSSALGNVRGFLGWPALAFETPQSGWVEVGRSRGTRAVVEAVTTTIFPLMSPRSGARDATPTLGMWLTPYLTQARKDNQAVMDRPDSILLGGFSYGQG